MNRLNANRHANARQLVTRRQARAPFSFATYLALLNAKSPISLQQIIDFIRVHFPGCLTPENTTYKISIRLAVSNPHNKNLFLRKTAQEMGLEGKKTYWTIRNGSKDDFMELLDKWMQKSGSTLNDMGMRNTDDWNAILDGSIGLPPKDHSVLKEEEEAEKQTERQRQQEEEDRRAAELFNNLDINIGYTYIDDHQPINPLENQAQ